ncbi:MAG: heme ABC transporter permease CcmC [Rhodobacteraceae bacterium]|nr:heme ABC transporter permease CcmC [Paracoccaceae bacterium]
MNVKSAAKHPGLANPNRFVRLTGIALPYLWAVSAILLSTGLVWGFAFTPADFRQGETVKIIFVHVPSALVAINVWLMMLAASLFWFIRRHHVSILAAKAAAPVGAVMTLVGILTGAAWGQVTWGTWWAWEPRLTSFLILLLCYAGYILLWRTLENSDLAGDVTASLCLFGSVFALLSRYAVIFWSRGLHQDASLSLDRQTNIHDAYYVPLLFCIAGFMLLSVTLILYRTRTEIRHRRIEALQRTGQR